MVIDQLELFGTTNPRLIKGSQRRLCKKLHKKEQLGNACLIV